MHDGLAPGAAEVLRVLADLSPAGEERSTKLTIPTEWFRWLPLSAVSLFPPTHYVPEHDPGDRPPGQTLLSLVAEIDAAANRHVDLDRQLADRLAAIDQIRPEQRSLRMGWLFVAGRIEDREGQSRRVFRPLVTLPVRVVRQGTLSSRRLVAAGDVEISELVTDQVTRHRLEKAIHTGGGAMDLNPDVAARPDLLRRLDGLQRFARDAAAAAGIPARQLVPAGDDPNRLMRLVEPVIVAGAAVYAVHYTGTTSRAGSLRAWAAGPMRLTTAFHSLYLDDEPAEQEDRSRREDPHNYLDSPYLLTPVQRDAVLRSRTAPLTLVAGAPGTGKSHTIAAIAADALARGQSVLVTAKADSTVDALLELLKQAPGPDPVVFGSNERREELAQHLAAGQIQPVSDDDVARTLETFGQARSLRDSLRNDIAQRLEAERWEEGSGAAEPARGLAPGLFDADADLDLFTRLLDTATAEDVGWWRRRKVRRARLEASRLARSAIDLPAERLREPLRLANLVRHRAALASDGGLYFGDDWDRLREAEDEARRAGGSWLAAQSRSSSRLSRSSLSAVALLATALRSGRAARREQLLGLDERLTQALPLWIGTLADIDDLLPPVAGLFDLVIMDEASSIDQPLAAPALLRAKRGVIVGDPHQLRHVSFLSDARMATVLADHELDTEPLLAARLDVRRNSVFDVAAGVAPVTTLDEHFRCAPHLVDFVARRIYGGTVKVATRAPSTASKDCIDVIRLNGRRDPAGVVTAEVDQVVAELQRLIRSGCRSAGVVTPFRAQADALENAVLTAFTADELERLDLRVGTVHAFQGNEKDVVIASLGVGPDEGAATWRFVEDTHLFVVLATRARKRMTLLISAEPPGGGLFADYLAQADAPPNEPTSTPSPDPWTAALAADLESAGVQVWTSYPSGRHHLDICVGRDGSDISVECHVHPDGAGAHIDRHLALRRSGWNLLDAYPSRWVDRRGELVVELLRQIGARPTG